MSELKQRKPSSNRKIMVSEGDVYGILIVIEETARRKSQRMVICICRCGNKTTVKLDYLRNGHTKSCGCLKKIKTTEAKYKHGESGTRLHRIWSGMKTRCNNKNRDDYYNYGGRGIKYCAEWEVYENFRDWAVNNGYKARLTLDRINVDGDYEPNNCKWSTITEQARNKRNNVKYLFDDKNLTVKEWSNITGLSEDCILYRLSKGWTIGKTLTTPSQRRKGLK